MSINIDKIENNDFEVELKRLGLTEKEAEVYLALLTLGEVGSSKIIKKTGLHGQFVYTALDALSRKGLVQHVVKRGRKKFSARNPKTLVQLIDRQKRTAEEIAERLNQLMVIPTRNEFEVFQGAESYIAQEFDLLDQATVGCELLIIGGSGDRFHENMGSMIKEYEKKRQGKAIRVRYLGSEDQREYLAQNKKARTDFDYRILPGLFTGMVNTNIWPETISLNIFGEPVTKFVISSSVVAGSYRQFFETLWRMGKE